MFKVIDSEEKAYWLGFITGDGSVSKYMLRIELSNRDKEHLEKFKVFMKSSKPIKNCNKNCSCVIISDKELIKDLSRYNIVQNKTYKDLGTPDINKNLLVHYYRGLLDSDGWITQVYQDNKYRGGIGFCSYKQTILLEILNFLKSNFPRIKSSVNTYKRKEGKWQVSQLQIGGTKLFIDVYNFFYKDAVVYLNRKKNIGQQICDNIINNKMIGKTRDNLGRFTKSY